MRVVHNKKSRYTVYIGRPSLLGNPFSMADESHRSSVIKQFEEHARSRPDIMEAIRNLKENDILGCWCAPKPCHGDVIIKLWKEMHNV